MLISFIKLHAVMVDNISKVYIFLQGDILCMIRIKMTVHIKDAPGDLLC
jgi:hypothetical protein